MKTTLLSLSALILAISATTAMAGNCDVKYTRTACPGQEAASFKKCDGKVSCIKVVPADSEQSCRVKAVAACANDRVDITKSKVINATYDGKPVLNKAGGPDHCKDYAARSEEFDQCS
ncbi:MAG: hypothetical protein V4633_25840 [Pseudomonadota bacterium]